MGRASNAEKQPTGRGPEGCVENGPAAALLLGYVSIWDVGEGGYQVGNFPVLWAEWNGRYRDSVRSYWKGDEGLAGEIAYRLTGSPDLNQCGLILGDSRWKTKNGTPPLSARWE
jgi:hypothetical protein